MQGKASVAQLLAYLLYFRIFRLVHGNGIPMGNVPWDGTARIAFTMGPMGQIAMCQRLDNVIHNFRF